MSEIKPALTEGEWKAALRDRGGMAAVLQLADDHGAAALHLIYQPYGFTWEDVDALRLSIAHHVGRRDIGGGYGTEVLARKSAEFHQRIIEVEESLADRISALLPPRP